MEKKKAGLASLSEWKHINCLQPDANGSIQDDVLHAVLPECRSDFKPYEQRDGRSRTQNLLEAVDLENIQAMDKTYSVTDFPGGTVSFLFEKSTTDSVSTEGEDVQEVDEQR
jgi:DNA repair and recombination protein RAD54B